MVGNNRFLEIPMGRDLVFDEFQTLIEKFRAKVEEFKLANGNWHFHLRVNNKNGLDILSYGYQLSIKYNENYNSTPYTSIALVDGYFGTDGNADILNPVKLIDENHHKDYQFNFNDSNQNCWCELVNQNQLMSTEALINFWFNELMKYAEKKKIQKIKQ